MNLKELAKIDYSNQRVLTTKQLAEAYGTTPPHIKDNFHYAKKHFIEGVDYFKVTGLALRQLKAQLNESGISASAPLVSKTANAVMLWTEQGAVRHCKMLGTQKAWNVFNELHKVYFQSREESASEVPAETELPAENSLPADIDNATRAKLLIELLNVLPVKSPLHEPLVQQVVHILIGRKIF